MKNPRRIDFTLIFDASDGLWPSVAAFDLDMARFFKDHGVEATIVKSVENSSAQYTLFLSKIPQVANMPSENQIEPKKSKSVSPGKQVSNVMKSIGRK